ncbi:MAG: CPBP family intramembrane glutamic endopeptidase [Chitinophagaceae bacterium]
MNQTLRTLAITVICFLLYYIAFEKFEPIMLLADRVVHYRLLSYFITYWVIGIPIFIGTLLINENHRVFRKLGLGANPLTALLLAAVFALPMFIGGLIFYPISSSLSFPNLVAGTLFAGFFEELYFRGFLFGQVFRNTKLGFLPSIFLGAVIFACGHLYQSQDAGELAGIFITTFMGAIFFAWLFVEWNYNLWVPIFLHTLMNLAWQLFDVSDNALGNVNSNIFRGLTIALAIIITIVYKRRTGQKLAVNRDTIWIKQKLPHHSLS